MAYDQKKKNKTTRPRDEEGESAVERPLGERKFRTTKFKSQTPLLFCTLVYVCHFRCNDHTCRMVK